MTKADELLSKMSPLPCAECGKPNTVGHVCMTSELSNKALADRLEVIYHPNDGNLLDEAAKRLRESDKNMLEAQLQQVKDIVKYMRTFACDAEIIENEFL